MSADALRKDTRRRCFILYSLKDDLLILEYLQYLYFAIYVLDRWKIGHVWASKMLLIPGDRQSHIFCGSNMATTPLFECFLFCIKYSSASRLSDHNSLLELKYCVTYCCCYSLKVHTITKHKSHWPTVTDFILPNLSFINGGNILLRTVTFHKSILRHFFVNI